ncbi:MULTISPECIES: bifunctional DNA primase/polymerase [unclassified Streptomyces]|uniref:bifunctional DNA primase/polymerase n=1 Tax=unclassified Streptomyces TaxID=2593676 RepID=UPI0006FFA7C3|nr:MULTISPECIES: bifunctional DNA primase/polymerase [unclassified Streptomyces]KQX49397.1 DNA primase [Streptomyces sp. Root1304]KRA79015.1 DNA primase [Streptomyces sp. Root66D1]
MREILGRRRRLRFRRKARTARLDAAVAFAVEWDWPVLPGAGLRTKPRTSAGLGATARTAMGLGSTARAVAAGSAPKGPACACPDPDCVVPGAHPYDPGLLAATTDERMIRWWWTRRPEAPVLLATGGRAPCAVSLPAVAGARALAALDAMGMRLGPVVATPTRWSILVAPYGLERLGELLYAKDSVPSSLRFHGEGGYLLLPPSVSGTGQVRWERAPLTGSARPWLPDVEAVVDALVEASTSTPGGGSRLAY